MARSKNKVIGVDPDGTVITAQVQLENGEVVIGHYKAVVYLYDAKTGNVGVDRAMFEIPEAE